MSKNILVYYEEKPSYPIVIEPSYEKLKENLIPLGIENRRLCIVTESTVGPLYAEEVKNLLSPYAHMVTVFTFPAGEANKNLSTVQDLYEFLIQNQFDRSDMLLALGGGVVGDLAGYAAATYLRGIDFVQLPTSLLAQVDSSIGGKTGVDFNAYKNMVGAFYQPKLVYMNLAALNTLPKREYLSGMGEVIKHGLIKDAAYYRWLCANADGIFRRDMDILEEMIERSCQIKRAVVESDPKEKGERALLNFGHTLGHAIERLKGFTLLHGECVALGMVAAAYMSMQRSMITKEEYDDFLAFLKKLNLPVCMNGLSVQEIIRVSKNDKKMQQGVIKFILLKEIGCAYIDLTVSETEMKYSLENLLNR